MICPHCNKVIIKAPDELVEEIERLDLPRRQYLIVLGLFRHWPGYTDKTILMNEVWDERDMAKIIQPNPEKLLSPHVSRINSALEAIKSRWRIQNFRYRGYRFMAEVLG